MILRERERELRREGGKSLLAYVKGVDPYLIHIDRPTTIRSPEHISGWVNYPPAYVIWVDGCVARTAGRGDVPYWLAPVGASYSVAYALGAEAETANDLD